MKALAVDCANTKILISAKNDDKIVTVILDIGMKQSETLLPSIDYVLAQTGLTAAELDYSVLCKGPGSFTGLRLGFAALKAIEMAHEVPVYGVLSLDAYAFAYKDFPYTVISVIDAKKDKFYAGAYKNGEPLFECADFTLPELSEKIKDLNSAFVCGPDCKTFISEIKELVPNCNFFCATSEIPSTESLFVIAEQMIEQKKPALAEYDGPVYLRLSEAEENLSK